MGARGRKSLAGLSVVPVSGQRIAPPEYLTPPQAEEWRQIVDSLPADYFRPGDAPLLEAYVVACSLYREATQVVSRDGMIVETTFGPKKHPAHAIMTAQAAVMAQMAVKLRLSQSARYTEKTAATKTAKTGARRPWEINGAQAAG